MFEDELEKEIIDKDGPARAKKKKICIFIIIGIAAVAIISAIIIIISIKRDGGERKGEIYGKFECTYYSTSGQNTYVFSKKAADLSPFTINGTKCNGTNPIITQTGYVKVIITFDIPINMDNLFSGTQ